MASITASLDGSGSGSGSGAGLADVSLPQVNLDTTGAVGDMKPTLERLGMGVAFEQDADLAELSPDACCTGFVRQAATLQVGEKGTVGAAAAAVAMGVASASMAPQDVVTITFNRPYLLLISAKATGEPLFLATVGNPTAS